MGKLLACDLDGTLFYPHKFNRCISKRNVRFLQHWIDSGNQLALVTSRSVAFVNRLKDEIQRPFDIIGSNSCQIIHNGEYINHEWMDNASIKAILKEIDEKYKPLALLVTTQNHSCIIQNTGRVNWFFRLMYDIYWFFQFHYREQYILEVDNKTFNEELENGKIYKIMTFFGMKKKKADLTKEINKEIREKYDGKIESSWTSIVNELTPPNCDKGAGVDKYCKALNINPDDVYVIGDSGNDISMFNKFHEHSYCMSHAYPSVKKYAKHVVTRVYKLDKLVLKGESKC